jgi:hypothetical protein
MKTITFIPTDDSVIGKFHPPIPAYKCLPEWYNHQPAYSNDKMIVSDAGIPNITIKKCMPVLDDMLAGYIIKLGSDLLINRNDDNEHHTIQWSIQDSPDFVSTHSTQQISHFPVPFGYSPHPFKFTNYWRIKTPPGYSCMFRHPFYHNSQDPFYTLSGIVDTDTHPVAVNFPFLLKYEFDGIIEADTPIVQIIPFKRQEWQHKISMEDNSEGIKEFQNTSKKWMHRYKDNFRREKKWR